MMATPVVEINARRVPSRNLASAVVYIEMLFGELFVHFPCLTMVFGNNKLSSSRGVDADIELAN